jgi:NAD(P)H-quinone oxidoreductase subunit 5
MHAGIINAGGFLIIRLSPMLQHAKLAHIILTFFGSVTAVFGALVMITQNDIKKKLAFSTISQMGVMMVSCGLGAYSLALFHIIAHSFYKAHAFLSTGFLVEESKKVKFNHSKPSLLFLILGATFGYLLVTLGIVYADSQYIAYFTYSAILMLGFVQKIDFGEQPFFKMGLRFFSVLLGVFIFSLGICFAFESFLHAKLASLTPMTWGENSNYTVQAITCFASYTIFAMGLGLSTFLIDSKGSLGQKIFLYFWNFIIFFPSIDLKLNSYLNLGL